MVLNVMLAKIATNLKAFGSCEDVVEQTLTLFQVSGAALPSAAHGQLPLSFSHIEWQIPLC